MVCLLNTLHNFNGVRNFIYQLLPFYFFLGTTRNSQKLGCLFYKQIAD